MSETDLDDQNEPASEEPEKEVQNVDDEEAKEKVVKNKHPSPIPDASIYARASMFNQSVAKKNGQLHRLFLNNQTDECLIIIEQLLEKHSEALCEYALICKARIAQDNGDIKTAIDSLTIALKNNSKSERLLYLLGRARYLQGDHLKAIECFKKSIEFNPTNWRAYYWAARSYYHSETEDDNVNLEKAQETLMSCPKANKSVDILVFLAKICIQKNQLIPAIEAFKRALEIEPENTEIIAELGLLYLKTNSDQKAFSCLGKALTYDPTHVPSILAASTVLQRNNDFDVALTKYRVAIEKCDYNGPLWNNIGMCFYGKGKLIAAISCLKKASYQYPLDCKVLFNLAITHRAMLQFASAYHFISSAVNLQNKNVIFIMTTAMILTDLEDFVSARKAYKKAMSIDPGNIVVRLNFAIFEYRRGNIEDAAKLLEPLNPAALGEIQDASDIISRINKLRSCLVQLHKEEQAQ